MNVILVIAMLIFSFQEKEKGTLTFQGIARESSVIDKLDDNTEPPLFPGCEKVNEMEKADCSHNKMYEYVAQHLQYPEEMKKNKIEGKVYVKFVITNNGYVSAARIQKALNPAADKAALEVVNAMNENVGKWTPGTKEGIPVNMDMVLPISFVLNPKPESNSNSGADSRSNADVYTYVEEMPRFPGCETDFTKGDCAEIMNKYISENISYPSEDRKNGKQGMVLVQFVVQADGSITNAHVLRGVTPGMDAEALRIVNNMNSLLPPWTPGKKAGKPVDVEFTLPIKFVLQSQNGEIKKSPADTTQEYQTLRKMTVIARSELTSNSTSLPNSDLQLSPNPARDHIEVDLFEGAQTIFVFAADGVQIAKVDVSKSTEIHRSVDVSKYPAGQYSLQVVSSKETRSGLFTVIK